MTHEHRSYDPEPLTLEERVVELENKIYDPIDRSEFHGLLQEHFVADDRETQDLYEKVRELDRRLTILLKREGLVDDWGRLHGEDY